MKSHVGLVEGLGRRWKSNDFKQKVLCFLGSEHRDGLCAETTLRIIVWPSGGKGSMAKIKAN